jgi:transcriptional regulator with XRE-family HTH domain
MKFNVEKLKQISRPLTQSERDEMKYRNENREWLALSAKFALSVREILRTDHISQTELASRMGVSCAQVTKLLSGKENIGLQTIAKVEKALGKKLVTFNIDEEDSVPTSTQYVFTQVISIPTLTQTKSFSCQASTTKSVSSLFSNNILV